MTEAIRDAAKRAYASGLCVLPPREDGSKRPIGSAWTHWQESRPDTEQMRDWYGKDVTRHGIGLVTGDVSNGLTAFEFDSYETYEAFLEAAQEIEFDWLVEKIRNGYEEKSPRGGIHWLYYCEDVQPNIELASRLKTPEEMRHPKDKYQVLIETRGEGGYIVIAPSHGPIHPDGGAYELLQGSLDTIATIEPEEQVWLFNLARVFDELPKVEFSEPRATPHTGKRPGDEFNERGPAWPEILNDHGWSRVFHRGETEYWRRPGKDDGISATINGPGVNPDRLYVFTTSTIFEARKSYSKFQAYAMLEHGGDFAEAARTLGAEGYGEQPSTATITMLPTPARPSTDGTTWPALPSLTGPVFYGLAGQIVRTIEPETEADPMGVLLTLLTAFGNIAGARPHWRVGAAPHRLLLNTVLVGPTSKGRKGTTWGAIKPVLQAAAPQWVDRNVVSGLSSGEGLIWAVRDPIYKQEPIKEKGKITGYQDVMVDAGVEDKRLFVIEEEFASTIKVMRRESNILSAVIRQAWDDGNLRTLTKNNPARSTGAHISVLGHITQDELVRYLEDTETGNGFANRFLWVAVRRSKALPGGGDLHQDDIDMMGEELSVALANAKRIDLMTRDAKANELWFEIYEGLSEGGFGLMGAVTSRAEAQVMRIAAVYAAIDGASQISEAHLSAALGIWNYCEASASYVFGDSLGDPIADGALQLIRDNGEMTQAAIGDAFGRHVPAAKLERALTQLLKVGKIKRESKATGGRPATVWRIA